MDFYVHQYECQDEYKSYNTSSIGPEYRKYWSGRQQQQQKNWNETINNLPFKIQHVVKK